MKKTHFAILAVMLIAVTACNNYGKEIDHNGLKLFYKEGVTIDEVIRLEDFLVKGGFGSGQSQAVQILKPGNVYQFKMVVKDDAESQRTIDSVGPEFAADISQQVFNGASVELHVCNDRLETLHVLQMDASAGWKTYAKDNYSVKYPTTWQVDESGTGNALFMINSPVAANGYRNTVNLTTEDLSANPMDLHQYTSLSVENAFTNPTDAMRDPQLIDTSFESNNGMEHARLIATFISQAGLKIRMEQNYYITNNKAYVLSFGSEEGSTTADVIKTGERVMNSFVVQ